MGRRPPFPRCSRRSRSAQTTRGCFHVRAWRGTPPRALARAPQCGESACYTQETRDDQFGAGRQTGEGLREGMMTAARKARRRKKVSRMLPPCPGGVLSVRETALMRGSGRRRPRRARRRQVLYSPKSRSRGVWMGSRASCCWLDISGHIHYHPQSA